ncbi:hypothetical protein HMPREF1981_01602 [Bacteroides pyogenes F0041]|uniref:DUF4421 domain-containing protein n=1 Tax=Bacteroides pyogenes F0041 TaxID=1321819 RepID=U2CLV6_9BACE|nr:DUF4421 domain-containing protein [Bacteroides pyogenes]ERI85530.1 hypothetical protein HMPREF1981_01602 [Bacteroides pyogenes F0041]MBB3893913.1 hypothetical protein [Bacteroides pyogenes]SUV33969.1 Uncharacterised protein [Bacteroides pyogenes]
MIKKTAFILVLFYTLPLCAHTERDTTFVHDSIPSAPQTSGFKKAIRKFLNFSDFDTLYISPNRYNYTIMGAHITNFEYYSLSGSEPDAQKISFSPNPHHKVGLYFGWRWIFLGWSVDVNDISRKTNRKNKNTEFDLSLYSSKIGLDLFYRNTGNRYKIHKLKGFPEDIPPRYSAKFDGLNVNIKGLNVYYIFNNRKFSYPAAFSQSTNQRRNAGSLIAGFSFSKHKLDFDNSRFPDFVQKNMNPDMRVTRIEYSNASFNIGYAYNWVFARNCLACLSLNPSVAYKSSDISVEASEVENTSDKISVDFLTRAGVVYNNRKYYVGTSFVGQVFNYHRSSFSLHNGFGVLQIYAGFNFHLRKEYRKRKRK